MRPFVQKYHVEELEVMNAKKEEIAYDAEDG